MVKSVTLLFVFALLFGAVLCNVEDASNSIELASANTKPFDERSPISISELEKGGEVSTKNVRDIPQYERSAAEKRDAMQTLLPRGSHWKFINSTAPSNWMSTTFTDSAWATSVAPFVTGYTAYVGKGTPFGRTDYFFRAHFTIPAGKTVAALQVNVASDNHAIVYVNGQLVDTDPSAWHEAKYWNRQINVAPHIIVSGDNLVAVVTKNLDQWAFFDLEIGVSYGSATNATLIPTGSSWSYFNASVPAATWIQQAFDDTAWRTSVAPFVTGYTAYVGKGTAFNNRDYYFRHKFTIPTAQTVTSMTVSIASDNTAVAYLNGHLVDTDPATWHEAKYWNRQVSVDPSFLVSGTNVLAVLTKNLDRWAFFDAQLTCTLSTSSSPSTPAPTSRPTPGPTSRPTPAPTHAPAPSRPTPAPTHAPTHAPAPSTDLCALVPAKTEPLKILVPLYVYPGAAWDQLVAAANSGVKIVAIINPNSGPSPSGPDASYKTYIKKMQDAGIELVGYVHTSWGARDINTVKSEIDKYATAYTGLTGIFFDEAATDTPQIPYYTTAYNYVKSKSGYNHVILNPGIQPVQGYVAISTNIVIYENYATSLASTGYGTWVKCAPNAASKANYKYHYSAIVHTATLASMPSYISSVHNKGIGMVYITDGAGGCCTYNTLTTYFAQEAAAVKSFNS